MVHLYDFGHFQVVDNGDRVFHADQDMVVGKGFFGSSVRSVEMTDPVVKVALQEKGISNREGVDLADADPDRREVLAQHPAALLHHAPGVAAPAQPVDQAQEEGGLPLLEDLRGGLLPGVEDALDRPVLLADGGQRKHRTARTRIPGWLESVSGNHGGLLRSARR